MRRTAWCEKCRKPFQAKSRSQVLCAECSDGAESHAENQVLRNDALVNTLAPDAGSNTVFIDDPDLLRHAVRRPPVRDIDCPDCGETIKDTARNCRFCGADVSERGAVLRRAERQREKRVDRRVVRRGGNCVCGGMRVPKTPVWAIICAVVFFPLGLFLLIVKEQRCTRCGS